MTNLQTNTKTTTNDIGKTNVNTRVNALSKCIPASILEAVQRAKVLVVGAGGIGSELLKNLVLSGFRCIHVIDLDTIDVSNLNRQFLFRRKHVGMSKAKVSREAALRFNPAVEIVADHANIKEERFGASYFEQFALVMNALDNLEARRHVNRLCVAKDIPLIESGTQGYIGQTTVIRKGTSECFECQPQAVPKTFAVCTIRNTPDKPIHCVVWAKHVFNLLFGKHDDENMLSDLSAALESRRDAAVVFQRLFHDNVLQTLKVEERWANRAKPTPLKLEELLKEAPEARDEAILRDQRVLSAAENAHALMGAMRCVYEQRSEQIGQMEFDKDDEMSMTIVSALANLRMSVFGIERQSLFAVKGIAGNIVHAIATTNAIAAGLIVLEAFKVLSGQMQRCKTVWIQRFGPAILQPQALEAPNSSCYVCRKNQVCLRVDTKRFTLAKLYSSVLAANLGMNQPSIDVSNRDNYLGTQDEHEQAYLNRPLADSGVRIDHGALLCVDDFTQAFECNVLVEHCVDLHEDEVPEGFQVLGELEAAQRSQSGDEQADDEVSEQPPAKKQRLQERKTVDEDEDDVVLVEEDDVEEIVLLS